MQLCALLLVPQLIDILSFSKLHLLFPPIKFWFSSYFFLWPLPTLFEATCFSFGQRLISQIIGHLLSFTYKMWTQSKNIKNTCLLELAWIYFFFMLPKHKKHESCLTHLPVCFKIYFHKGYSISFSFGFTYLYIFLSKLGFCSSVFTHVMLSFLFDFWKIVFYKLLKLLTSEYPSKNKR